MWVTGGSRYLASQKWWLGYCTIYLWKNSLFGGGIRSFSGGCIYIFLVMWFFPFEHVLAELAIKSRWFLMQYRWRWRWRYQWVFFDEAVSSWRFFWSYPCHPCMACLPTCCCCFMVNVGIYTIHGCYGLYRGEKKLYVSRYIRDIKMPLSLVLIVVLGCPWYLVNGF